MTGIITALKIQKYRRDRVDVFIDCHFAFSVGIDLAASLTKGQHLSPARIDLLKQTDLYEKAYHDALRFLGHRPRSKKEILGYLCKRGYSADITSDVLDRLIRANYLDDGMFARYWIENRERFRPRSSFALRHELRQKGVDDTLIDPLLDDWDEDKSALKAAEQTLPRWKKLDQESFKRKLFGFLQRRGFSYEVSNRVFHRLIDLCRSK